MGELEAQLEAYFVKKVRLAGGYTIKLAPTERGVPDRLVIRPGGYMHLVELKTETGRLSRIQSYWHNHIRSNFGVRVYVLHGRKEIDSWVRRMINDLPTPVSSSVG